MKKNLYLLGMLFAALSAPLVARRHCYGRPKRMVRKPIHRAVYRQPAYHHVDHYYVYPQTPCYYAPQYTAPAPMYMHPQPTYVEVIDNRDPETAMMQDGMHMMFNAISHACK